MTDEAGLPRGIAIGVAAMSLFALLPAAASATDYCVVPNTGCGGTNVATFSEALNLADDATGADRVFLGASIYVAPTIGGFDYSKAGAPVDIAGKGAGPTILPPPAAPRTSCGSLAAPQARCTTCRSRFLLTRRTSRRDS